MKIGKWLLILACVLLLSGCSTAGPFVTGVSSDGKGNLIVQKGYVEYNGILGVVGNKEANETTIKLFDK